MIITPFITHSYLAKSLERHSFYTMVAGPDSRHSKGTGCAWEVRQPVLGRDSEARILELPL